MDIDARVDIQEENTRLGRGRKAKPEVAAQIREARSLKVELARREQRAQPGDGGTPDLPRPGFRRFYDPTELVAKRDWARSLSGDSKDTLKAALDKAGKLGSYRRIATAPAPEALDELLRDFPNFNQVTEMLQRRLLLCRLAPEQLLKLPPVLLDGPPGVGKTSYCRRLAAIMAMHFESIDLSSAGVDFAMVGLDIGYSTGKPGRVWDSLARDCVSVLWLLDEIDKTESSRKDSGINYLLGLLEPVSARQFKDSGTQLAVDASWIAWIATSNDQQKIEAPIRSRFQVFDISVPSEGQMQAVVRSIHREIMQSEDWAAAFGPELGADILAALGSSSPREIRQRLEDGYATAAARQRRELLVCDLAPARQENSRTPQRIGFV